MMRGSLLLLLTLVSLGACKNESASAPNDPKQTKKADQAPNTKDSSKVESTNAPPSSASSVAAASPAPPVASGAVKLEPGVPVQEKGMMDHSDWHGWAADSSEYGYCYKPDAAGGRHCAFKYVTGGADRIDDDGAAGSDLADPKIEAKIDAVLIGKKIGAQATTWPYGADMTLTWQNDASGAAVQIGAKLAGESPGWALSASPGSDYSTHVEDFSISPDGQWVGVISHGYKGEFSDTFTVDLLSTQDFAARVYNATGLHHHEKKDWAAAAKYFTTAHAVDPKAELYAYNLACAEARLGDDSKAEAALKESISLGGDAVKTRASKDDDFDSAKAKAWFTDLTK